MQNIPGSQPYLGSSSSKHNSPTGSSSSDSFQEEGSSSDFFSRSSDSSGSSAWRYPQKYSVKETESHRVRQTNTFVHSHLFQNVRWESPAAITSKEQEAILNRYAKHQPLLSLGKGGNRFKWHDFFTPVPTLQMLHKVAMSDTQDCPITSEELLRILAICKRESVSVFVDFIKCQVISYRILQCLAKHRWELPKEAIDILIDECRALISMESDPNTSIKKLPYAAMALGQTIYFNPSVIPLLPTDFWDLLDAVIGKLQLLDGGRFIEVIALLLAVKAREGKSLTTDDLLMLYEAIVDPGEDGSRSLYYQQSEVQQPNPSSNYITKNSRFPRKYELFEAMVNGIQGGGTLSWEEVSYIAQRCIKGSIRTQYKTLRLAQLLVTKSRQRLPEDFLEKIFEWTNHPEFKFRSRALMISKILLANRQDIPEHFIQKMLVGQYHERFFALSSLSDFLDLRREASSSEEGSGREGELLSNIGNSLAYIKPTFLRMGDGEKGKTLDNLVSYVNFRITNQSDPRRLEELLDDPEFSVMATGVYLKRAKRCKFPPDSALDKIGAFILCGSQSLHHHNATLNAIGTFRYIAENYNQMKEAETKASFKEKIQEIVANEDQAVIQFLDDHNIKLREAMLLLLGAIWNVLPKKSISPAILERIVNSINEEPLIHACCIALFRWLDVGISSELSREIDLHQRLLIHLIGKLQHNVSLENKISLSLVIGKAVEGGYVFSSEEVQWILDIALRSADLPLQYRLSQVLSIHLNKQSSMSFSEKLVELLCLLCSSHNELYLQNCGSLLCYHIRISEGVIPDTSMHRLGNLLVRKRTRWLGLSALDELTKRPSFKEQFIDEKMIHQLFDLMLDVSEEMHGYAAPLLFKIVDIHDVTITALPKVLKGLRVNEEIVIETSLKILRRCDHLLFTSQDCIDPLIEVATTVHRDFRVRLQAFSLLLQLSGKSIAFKLSFLHKLTSAFADPIKQIRLEAIKVVSSQSLFLRDSVSIGHPFIRDLECTTTLRLDDSTQCEYGVEILRQIVGYGHQLSLITLGKLAEVLTAEDSLTIAQQIYEILARHKDQLVGPPKRLYQLQTQIEFLKDPLVPIQIKNEALRSFMQLLLPEDLMIQALFNRFFTVLETEIPKLNFQNEHSQEFIKLVLEISLQLYREDIISHQLVWALSQIGRQLFSPHMRMLLAQFFAECLKKNIPVDSEVFPVVEEGFLRDDNFESTSLYLVAIDCAIKRNFVVRIETVEVLGVVLTLGGSEERKKSCLILHNLLASSGPESRSVYVSIIKSHLLPQNTDHSQEDPQFTILSMLDLLIDRSSPIEAQMKVISLFDQVLDEAILKKQCQDFLAFKRSELFFIERVEQFTTTSTKEAIHKLFSNLGLLSHALFKVSDETLYAIGWLLKQDEAVYLMQTVDCLDRINKKQPLPKKIFSSLLLAIVNKYSLELLGTNAYSLYNRVQENDIDSDIDFNLMNVDSDFVNQSDDSLDIKDVTASTKLLEIEQVQLSLEMRQGEDKKRDLIDFNSEVQSSPRRQHQVEVNDQNPSIEDQREFLLELLQGISQTTSPFSLTNGQLIDLTVNCAVSLCKKGWNFARLFEWIESASNWQSSISDRVTVEKLFHVITKLNDYQTVIFEYQFYRLVDQSRAEGTEITAQVLHEHIVERHLSLGEVKSNDVLLEEIGSYLADNGEGQSDNDYKLSITKEEIKPVLELFNYCYQAGIKDWSFDQIKAWSEEVKRSCQQERSQGIKCMIETSRLPECLAVLQRACTLMRKIFLRPVQLISIIIMLSDKNDTGLLAQIATGEGKSLIIAMLAIIKALQGRRVDIMTSSPLLAMRDVEEWNPFYKVFCLRAASNEDQEYESGLKPCYRKEIDIVYGHSDQFQFDYLRDKCNGLKTRGERSFDYLIMDEADNVIIEGNDSHAMLSTPIPAMQELTPLLIAIWIRLCTITTEERTKNKIEQGGELVKKEEFSRIEGQLMKYIKQILDENENIPSDRQLYIPTPNHLKPFVESQAPLWILSAWMALVEYESGHHYKIDQDKIDFIAPIDFSNSGVVQVGTTWGQGLHQFIQIKHALNVTPLSLVTNYSSIRSYVRKYSDHVGITGTLGSGNVQKMLYEKCHYRSIQLPISLSSQRLELSSHIITDEEVWKQMVYTSALREAEMGRVVLVVCEAQKLADEIADKITKSGFSGCLHKYADNRRDSNLFFNKCHSGNTIIVSTNLSGRGTDIKITDNVIKRGGVHVLVTFLPIKSRIRDQVFGRASRRGEPGSVQLLLNERRLKESLKEDADKKLILLKNGLIDLEQLRDSEEQALLAHLKNVRLKEIDREDGFFSEYLELVDEIKTSAGIGKGGILSESKKFFDAEEVYLNELNEVKLAALEEQWGLWHSRLPTLEDAEEIEMSFLEFKRKVRQDFSDNSIIENPIYYIRLGNQLLQYSKSLKGLISKEKLLQKCLEVYDKAIEMDSVFSYHAYYHKAYVVIALKDINSGYKEEAKRIFEEMIEEMKKSSFISFTSLSNIVKENPEGVFESIQQQLGVYLKQETDTQLLLINSAVQAIATIEESKKLIEIQPIAQTYSVVVPQRYSHEEINQQLDSLSFPRFNLIFHHLKTHTNDLTPESQVLNTVKKIAEDSECSSVRFTLTFNSSANGNDVDGLISLLPIHERKIAEMKELERIERRKEEAKKAAKKKEKREAKGREMVAHPSEIKPIQPFSPTSSSSSHPIIRASWGERIEGIGSSAGQVATKVGSYALKKGGRVKHAFANFGNAIADTISTFRATENARLKREQRERIPLTVTFKKLSLEKMKDVLHETQFVERQTFGIGPFRLTAELLEELKLLSSEVIMTLWYPSELSADKKSLAHYSPRRVVISELISELNLDKKGGEVSIIRCLRTDLDMILTFVSPMKSELTFSVRSLSQERAYSFIKNKREYQMAISFENMNAKNAKRLAKFTLLSHNHATLSLKNVDSQIGRILVARADKAIQHVFLQHRPLKDALVQIHSHHSNIHHFHLNGYSQLYFVVEQLPFPTKSVILLSTLTTIEVASGLLLTLLTGGVLGSVGQGLISEALIDSIQLIRVCYKREFQLSSYLLQKSFSMAMLLASAGFSSIDGLRKGHNALKIFLDFGDEAVLSAAMVGQRALQFTKSFAIQGAKSAGKGAVTTLMKTASQSFLRESTHSAKGNLESEINHLFSDYEWSRDLKLILAKDLFLNDDSRFKALQDQAKELIIEIENELSKTTQLKRGFSILVSDAPLAMNETIAAFRKSFGSILRTRAQGLHEMFRNLLIELDPQDFEGEWRLFEERGIIIGNETINLLRLEEYQRSEYSVETPLMKACLKFKKCLEADYFREKPLLVRVITDQLLNIFSRELESSLGSAVSFIDQAIDVADQLATSLIVSEACSSSHSDESSKGAEPPSSSSQSESNPSLSQPESSSLTSQSENTPSPSRKSGDAKAPKRMEKAPKFKRSLSNAIQDQRRETASADVTNSSSLSQTRKSTTLQVRRTGPSSSSSQSPSQTSVRVSQSVSAASTNKSRGSDVAFKILLGGLSFGLKEAQFQCYKTYQRKQEKLEEKQKQLLAHIEVQQSEKMVEIYKKLAQEQVEIIKTLIAALITRSKIEAKQRSFDRDEKEVLSQEVSKLWIEVKINGIEPLRTKFGSSTEQKKILSRFYVSLKNYQFLRRSELSSLYVSQKNPESEHFWSTQSLRGNSIGDLVDFGRFLQGGSASETSYGTYIGGLMVEQVGGIINSIIQAKSLSIQMKARVDCFTLSLIQETNAKSSSIMQAALLIGDQQQQVTEIVTVQLTDIAGEIVKIYKQFLDDLLNIAFDEETDVEGEIRRLEQKFLTSKKEYDDMVEEFASFVKDHAVNREFLSNCANQAAQFVIETIAITRNISSKSDDEINALHREIVNLGPLLLS